MGSRTHRKKNSLRGIQHVGRLSCPRSCAVCTAHRQQRALLHILQLPSMSAAPLTDLSRLCIHTITTKPWNVEEAAKHFSAAGVSGITVWRDALARRNIRAAGNMLRDQGLQVVSLCRGGFFPSTDSGKRKAAIDDNRRAI